MTALRVFAVDPALRTMGWCNNGQPVTQALWRAGVVHGAAPDQPTLRLYEHGRWLRDQLRFTPPHVVTMEGYALGMRDSSSLVSLGELGGVLKLVAFQEGIPLAIVPPSSLKLYALGKGGGKGTDKKAMVAAARRHLGYRGRDHNEADALWLWHMTQHHYGGTPRWRDAHDRTDEAINGAVWPNLNDERPAS